jgi:hypothetical protein
MEHVSFWSMLIEFMGGNTNAIHKFRGSVLDASKDAGLQLNAQKTKCVLMSRNQKTVV